MSGFKDWLKDQRYDEKLANASSFTKAYANLARVAEDFGSVVSKHKLAVELEEGWIVDMGQQYRFLIKLKDGKRDFQHILFRAYIASDGTITFDFNEEEHTECDGTDPAIVFNAVGKFLERDATLGVIQQIISVANKTPLDRLNQKMRGTSKNRPATKK